MSKDTDKGMMHSVFGSELCNGCKGLLVVSFIAPTQRDVASFANSFARHQKEEDEAADVLGEEIENQDNAPPPAPPPSFASGGRERAASATSTSSAADERPSSPERQRLEERINKLSRQVSDLELFCQRLRSDIMAARR